ncbi:hypothetical protein B0H13DRAFT_1856322 [Mycena leptocephala]|nr:hypothetical protein B0H13DRAFT_1856322 [Mycena leptocephala]
MPRRRENGPLFRPPGDTRHIELLFSSAADEKEAEAEDSDDWEDEEMSDSEKAEAGGKASSSRVAARDEGSDEEDISRSSRWMVYKDDLDLASETEELTDDVDARDVEELDHLTLEETDVPPSPSAPQSNEKGKGKVDSRSSPVRQNVVPKRKRSEPADNIPVTKKHKTDSPAQHALLLAKARREGWLTEINFDLGPRIHPLLPELDLLQTDVIVLEKSPVWLKFLERIDYQVFAFSKSTEQFPDVQLGCGYFGPKGHAVIAAHVKNQRHTVEESIFFRTVVKLVDLPRRWDSIGKESITAEHFATYVLVPYIAASLISVDLDISLQDAVNVLIDSREYGRVNHPEQSEASIPTLPNEGPTQPPRHRKKNVNLKLSGAKFSLKSL